MKYSHRDTEQVVPRQRLAVYAINVVGPLYKQILAASDSG